MFAIYFKSKVKELICEFQITNAFIFKIFGIFENPMTHFKFSPCQRQTLPSEEDVFVYGDVFLRVNTQTLQ